MTIWRCDALEHVPCDLCAADDTRPVCTRADGLSVVECAKCGLAYLDPRPRPDVVNRLYGLDYFARNVTGIGYEDYFGTYRNELVRECSERMRALGKRISFRGLRCLEVGCASGEFCEALRSAGAEPVGIDIAEVAINQARARYPHIDFRVCTVESLHGVGLFDAVFCFELLEHVLSPMAFLNSVRGLLKPGGYLGISVPNYQCAKVIGCENWLGFHHNFEHLYFFSEQSLASYALRTGFSVLDVWTGAGTGRLLGPDPAGAPRAGALSAAKVLAHTLGLMDLCRSVAARYRAWVRRFRRGGNQHTLLMLWRKEV